MADDSMNVSALLAPWMQQSPFDMSQYGGAGQFGAAMLAGAGPTPYRQPFLVGLGKAMQSGQANALQSAQQRMGLAGNSLMLQRQMAMWPMMMQALQQGAGASGGSPQQPASNQQLDATAGQPPPYYLSADPSADAAGGDSGSVQPPPWLHPATEGDIESTPVGGVNPAFYRLNALMSPNPMQALGALRDQQLKIRQQEAAPLISRLDTLIKSDNPMAYVNADPELRAAWPVLAAQRGFDPRGDFNNPNVRTAFAFKRNEIAGSLGEPLEAPPTQPVEGAYGSQYDVFGKRITEPKLPVYTAEPAGYDATTGHEKKQLVVTSPGATGRPGAPGATPVGRPGGGLGSSIATIDTGVPKPSADEGKFVEFADLMHGALPRVTQMEAQGYQLPVKARAALIDAATNDSDSLTRQLLSQLSLKYGLDEKGKEYMSALMPMLQAVGHSMAGMRLTAGQMRTNFESIIPVPGSDPAAEAQVNTNRTGIYRGMLTQSGSAVYMPQYANSLGADLKKFQAEGSVPTLTPEQARALPRGTRFRTSDGRLLVRQ